jgi:hypothetical protein
VLVDDERQIHEVDWVVDDLEKEDRVETRQCDKQ